MLRVLETSGTALTLAGSLCGVPFVGAAAVIVGEIVKACNDVKIHKVKFHRTHCEPIFAIFIQIYVL
jgi:hypothetical protein